MRISDWSSDVCSSDLIVQQRRLAVVDVTHDGNDGRARYGFGLGTFGNIEESLGIVQLGGNGGMAQLLDHDHGGFLVQHQIDGDHLPQLHQMLADLEIGKESLWERGWKVG